MLLKWIRLKLFSAVANEGNSQEDCNFINVYWPLMWPNYPRNIQTWELRVGIAIEVLKFLTDMMKLDMYLLSSSARASYSPYDFGQNFLSNKPPARQISFFLFPPTSNMVALRLALQKLKKGNSRIELSRAHISLIPWYIIIELLATRTGFFF